MDDLSINKLALNSETQGGAKYYYLESTVERAEIPYVSDDYVLRMAISTQLDIAAAIIDLGQVLERVRIKISFVGLKNLLLKVSRFSKV